MEKIKLTDIAGIKIGNAQMNKVASMAHNGYARTIRPVHTSLDGDTIFAMTTAKVEANIDIVGTLGAFVMGKAINRAVQKATTAYGYVASCDKFN